MYNDVHMLQPTRASWVSVIWVLPLSKTDTGWEGEPVGEVVTSFSRLTVVSRFLVSALFFLTFKEQKKKKKKKGLSYDFETKL